MIIIIDFGSQTTHLISRRLRQIGVENIIITPNEAINEINKNNPKGIILSGGPASVYEKNAPKVDKKIFSLNIPILGICYGLQLTTHLLEGKVIAGKKEYGPETLTIVDQSPIFEGLPKNFTIWMSHGDEVVKLPKNFTVSASTQKVKYAAIFNKSQKIFGVQFHPEIFHTQYGIEILKNFVENICYLKTKFQLFNPDKIIEKIKEEYKKNGGGKVIAAISGGVDSTVASFLTAKAIGKNLIPIYIDNGLMRYGTKEKVSFIFEKMLKIKPRVVACENLFLKKLKGITDPEKKRKIIGALYVDLFQKAAKKEKGANFLLQGTIYSDVVESGGSKGKSAVIKSHHNVGGLPKNLKLKLLEPLREFYKDEVREIGKKLGLPDEVIFTQPFPGPGYAIRIIGEVTKKRLEKIKLADQILNDILKKEGFYEKIFQSFPSFNWNKKYRG